MKVVEACRQNGISDATFCKWRERGGDMTIAESRRLHQLEEENSRLKRLVAEQALDIVIHQGCYWKKTSEVLFQNMRCAFRSGLTRLF